MRDRFTVLCQFLKGGIREKLYENTQSLLQVELNVVLFVQVHLK